MKKTSVIRVISVVAILAVVLGALLNKKTIRAPFSGVLGLRLVDLGEYIGVGTHIVGINMLDPIQVDFTISERNLPRDHASQRGEDGEAAEAPA